MRISLVLLAFLALTAVACSTSTSSSSTNLCANSGAAITVDVTEYAFTPSSVTVIDGQSVCWANTGSMTHTVVEDVAGRSSGNLPPGQTLVHTFTGSAKFRHHLRNHFPIAGTIKATC